jgi:hypothetical protein
VPDFHAEDAISALAADLAACSFIRELVVGSARLDTLVALDALVDAALACRLHTLRLNRCELSAASAPALARLLGGGALAELAICSMAPFLHAAHTAEVLADALRACSTLTVLTLQSVRLWDDSGTATALLGALTGHASLRTLA